VGLVSQSLGTILGVVDECAIDVEADLMLVLVWRQLLPGCIGRVLLRTSQQQRPYNRQSRLAVVLWWGTYRLCDAGCR
jgi:hypothetical protein